MDPSAPNSISIEGNSANTGPLTDTFHSDSLPDSKNPSTSPPKFSNYSLPSETSPAPASATLQPYPVDTPTTSTSNPNARLRSSIACVRCRKSKIKCTNSGAGTTCEACAHSHRECTYPAPGTGGVKREVDGDDANERNKRPRARKSEFSAEKGIHSYSHSNGDYSRAQIRLQPSTQLSIKLNSLEAPALSGREWSEVFELFQLNYGTELSFLHAPTFLPRIADDPVQYAALTGQREDRKSLLLLKLGILTLTARHHEGLLRRHLSDPRGRLTPITADETSEHYASSLRGLLFEEDGLASTSHLDSPTLPMVQALLMLSLYEWSVRRGKSAWVYLGTAIRMAQVMEIMTEDLEINASTASSPTGLATTSLLHAATHVNDADTSEGFVQEESIRRTVWSCFILDRYFSNGSTRPNSMEVEKIHVQVPCGDNAWAFGERVCTPYFNGICSRHRERMKWKFEHPRKQSCDSHDERNSSASIDAMVSKIQCEYEKHEGINSRYVKLVHIWSKIASWSYQGGKSSEIHAHWYDNRSKYWAIKLELQKFVDEMPRSFQFTKANSQAHLSRHTSPPYTLLHTLFSICKLVMLKEFLPFSPVNVSSPSHLDEIEIQEPNNFNLKCYSNSLVDLFKTAYELFELLQVCKDRQVLPNGPIMAFGTYLVSFIGIYAIHFPHMDGEGWVAGRDSASERRVQITEALTLLSIARTHLPMAEYLFRTLHRLHRYYKSLNAVAKPNSFSAVNRNSPTTDGHVPDSIRVLDDLFKDLGSPEENNTTFTVSKEDIFRPEAVTSERSTSPPPLWRPVKPLSTSARKLDPLDRAAPTLGPQVHAQWYQSRGYPGSSPKPSPSYDNARTYPFPSNTLPPINSPPAGNTHPYTSHSSTPQPPKAVQFDRMLFTSGEDVAIFIDARNDKDMDLIKAGWKLMKNDKDPGIVGSPNHRARETSRMKAVGAGWLGLLWQW